MVISIQLTKGMVAVIDEDDFQKVSKYKWYYSHGYAVNKSRGKKVLYMHRLVMGIKESERVFCDHINRNGLDNRKCNLRICTNSLNNANRGIQCNNKSGMKGIHWDKANQKWYVQFKYQGKSIFLGRYKDKIEAAKVFDAKSVELFGDFAITNKSLGVY